MWAVGGFYGCFIRSLYDQRNHSCKDYLNDSGFTPAQKVVQEFFVTDNGYVLSNTPYQRSNAPELCVFPQSQDICLGYKPSKPYVTLGFVIPHLRESALRTSNALGLIFC